MRRIGALEAGGTKMVLAVGNENGEILDRMSIPTLTPEETMPKIIEYFKNQNVDSVGVGSFGPIDVNKKSKTYGYIMQTTKLQWRMYDILGEMERALNVPMYFDTDVNVAAIGEHVFGCAKDVDNVLYITIGTGVGAGIIVNGKPVHGATHPEGGHLMLQLLPGDTFEGNCYYHKTCLEGMCAGPAIEKRWGKKAALLTDIPEVWETESYYIAQALMDFIVTVSPEKIILGGGVMKQEQLFPLIRTKVKELLNGYITMPELDDLDNYIVMPSLNDNQGVLGCIAMALEKN